MLQNIERSSLFIHTVSFFLANLFESTYFQKGERRLFIENFIIVINVIFILYVGVTITKRYEFFGYAVLKYCNKNNHDVDEAKDSQKKKRGFSIFNKQKPVKEKKTEMTTIANPLHRRNSSKGEVVLKVQKKKRRLTANRRPSEGVLNALNLKELEVDKTAYF